LGRRVRPILFLGVDDVIAIHEDTIEHEGGRAGVRDRGLLESAVMMPRARFEGRYLHEGLPAMAAAYLFHIAMDHPFIDANKRTALAAALVFLAANGIEEDLGEEEVERVTLAVAAGTMGKDELTAWFLRRRDGAGR